MVRKQNKWQNYFETNEFIYILLHFSVFDIIFFDLRLTPTCSIASVFSYRAVILSVAQQTNSGLGTTL